MGVAPALKIKPKWIKLLFSGCKTCEVRKYEPCEYTPTGHEPVNSGQRILLVSGPLMPDRFSHVRQTIFCLIWNQHIPSVSVLRAVVTWISLSLTGSLHVAFDPGCEGSMFMTDSANLYGSQLRWSLHLGLCNNPHHCSVQGRATASFRQRAAPHRWQHAGGMSPLDRVGASAIQVESPCLLLVPAEQQATWCDI